MQTLCSNCQNNKDCNWQNDHIILCNEYRLEDELPKGTSKNGVLQIETGVRPISICSNCLHEDLCHFKQDNLNTVFCEEYQ